jgi:hypothetical protein
MQLRCYSHVALAFSAAIENHKTEQAGQDNFGQ